MRIENRKARFNYTFIDNYEAGIMLLGSEVKSLREGKGNISEAYIIIENDEVYILNMYIAKYNESSYMNHDEYRKRKLLLHKRQILSMKKELQGTGMTIIPVSLYLSKGKFKIEIALSKGKKDYDKRQSIKERELKRSIKEL